MTMVDKVGYGFARNIQTWGCFWAVILLPWEIFNANIIAGDSIGGESLSMDF